MAASAATGIVDPTKPAKYPVILSDALLGKSPKEIYTGVRYNHRPPLTSETAPSSARVRPGASNASFDLSFTDDGEKYAYTGGRVSGDNQYVLIFDPERKAFVLHRLDSVFNMNLARTPLNTNAESLKAQYPHLDNTIKVQVGKKSEKAAARTGGKAKDGAGANKESKKGGDSSAAAKKSKPEKKAASMALTLPAEPPKSTAKADKQKKAAGGGKKRDTSLEESEEDDDDDDGGLLIEYPEGHAPGAKFNAPTDFSPAFPTTIRRFSDFVKDGQAEHEDEEDDDAYGEIEDNLVEEEEEEEENDDNMAGFKLPSPVNQPNNAESEAGGHAEDEMDLNFEDEIEAELEKEFQQASGMDVDSESSVSEED